MISTKTIAKATRSFLRGTRGLSKTQPSSASRLDPMPVIVGSPRSGTTLLRFMLDSHPQLAIPPETGFLCVDPALRGSDNDPRESFVSAIVNFPVEAPNWPDFEIPEEVFRLALTRISPFNIAEGYRSFYRLYAARFGKPRWGDKTPLYCNRVDAMRKVLPEVRFIHIIRDGRDAALSLRRMRFSPGPEIETQAAYWRECVLAARHAGVGHPDYVEVRYKDLILNTRSWGMNCELEWPISLGQSPVSEPVRLLRRRLAMGARPRNPANCRQRK